MAEKHIFTEGEKACMEEYWKTRSKTPRKKLMKLVKHINMLNLNPTEESWEYIFFDRMLSDEMVDFLLKMKLRHPYYIKDLAQLEGMEIEETAKFADEMVHIGILEYTSDDEGNGKYGNGGVENGEVPGDRTGIFELYSGFAEKDFQPCTDGVCFNAGDSGGKSHRKGAEKSKIRRGILLAG